MYFRYNETLLDELAEVAAVDTNTAAVSEAILSSSSLTTPEAAKIEHNSDVAVLKVS